jgi:hypothetical protein
MRLEVMFGDAEDWSDAWSDDLREVLEAAFLVVRNAEGAYVKDAESDIVFEPEGGWNGVKWKLTFDEGQAWSASPEEERLFTTNELVAEYQSPFSLLATVDASLCSFCGGERYHLARSVSGEWICQCRECFQWTTATAVSGERIKLFKRTRPSSLA